MSDRYESPRWDDEPESFRLDDGSDEIAAGGEPTSEVDGSAIDTPDLDASSENVLDGWPAAEAAAVETSAVETDAVETVAEELDEPEHEAPERADEAPPLLADHVSATMDHAPGELTVPPGYAVLEGEANGESRRVGIVVARFNGDVTTELLDSALAELDARGVSRDSVTVMPVPGAFELPLAAMALAKTRRFSCIVALGCVIRGDTPHFDYVSGEAASGLQLAGIETGVPVAFGVLTLDRADQAESRYDKGAEAVRTGLEMADLFANLRAAAAR
jgi:6,7-dimethyl-8-ribityllumazine synthase